MKTFVFDKTVCVSSADYLCASIISRLTGKKVFSKKFFFQKKIFFQNILLNSTSSAKIESRYMAIHPLKILQKSPNLKQFPGSLQWT